MRPRGSPQELERRRQRAVKMLERGTTITAIARRIGCSHSSVILWGNMVGRRGAKGLKAKPASGRPPKLSQRQLNQLPKLLLKGAFAWGYTTDLWTTTRIAQVIRRKFHVQFHRAHVGRLLARLNWSCEKPERRALERDEKVIEEWKHRRRPAIRKKPGGCGFRATPLDSTRMSGTSSRSWLVDSPILSMS
jgi:transposase